MLQAGERRLQTAVQGQPGRLSFRGFPGHAEERAIVCGAGGGLVWGGVNFEAQIAAHAIEAAPNEACGLIVRSSRGPAVIRCENTAADPSQFFRIDPEKYLEVYRTDDLLAYYHSHPRGPETPSEPDKRNADALQLPVYVFGVETGRLDCYVPTRAPLAGRQFLPMVNDCVSLLWDFLQEAGINLPLLPRTQLDYRNGVEFDWMQFIEQAGAGLVPPGNPPERGDILVMVLFGSTKPNHVGIYLGKSRFLHQRGRIPSGLEIWGGQWKTHTSLVIRVPGAAATLDRLKL